MIWGALRMWWHALWRLHRMETCWIHAQPIGFDCECGEHFWHSKNYAAAYLAIRAAVPPGSRRQP